MNWWAILGCGLMAVAFGLGGWAQTTQGPHAQQAVLVALGAAVGAGLALRRA